MIVYKVKNYGALLIVEVIAANSIFLAIIKKVRRNKKKKLLHELYNLERAPSVNFLIVTFIALLDISKAFLLFWPANVMPMWLLVTIL